MTVRLRHAVILALHCRLPAVSADLFEIPGTQFPGFPPKPPSMSALGMMIGGKMAYDPTVYPTGPVASVTLEEYGLKSTDPLSSTTTQLDEMGRPTEIVRKNLNEGRTTFTYRDKLLVSRETTWSPRKRDSFASPIWQRWTYDSTGRLQQFQTGQGTEIQNDYADFKYDNLGRLVSYHERQRVTGGPDWRAEYTYPSSREYDSTTWYPEDPKSRSYRCTLDSAGRVAAFDTTEINWKTKKPERTYVTFRYDERSRVVEQVSVSPALDGPGSEFSVPPGTTTVTYDDIKHTKTVVSPDLGGGRLTGTFTYDDQGSVIKMGVHSQPTTESDSGSDVDLEFVRDQHGN
jgi:hypothetical protein